MKNAVSFTFSQVLSITLLLSAFTLGACTPEDKGVTNDSIRNMIQQKNKQKKGDFFQVSSFAMTSLMSDKVLEAAEIVRLSYQKENTAKTFYKVEAQPDQEDGSRSLLLTAEQKDFAHTTSQGDFLSSLKKQWKVTVSSPEKAAVFFTAEATNSEESLKKQGEVAGQESLVNFNEVKSMVTLLAVEADANVLAMSFNSEGILSASLTGNSTSEKFTISVLTSIEKAAFLEKGEIKITHVEATTSFAKAKKPFVISATAEALVLNADGLCSSLEGQMVIQSDRNKKQLSLEKDQVFVADSSFKSSLATCGQRPTVDLSRILIK